MAPRLAAGHRARQRNSKRGIRKLSQLTPPERERRVRACAVDDEAEAVPRIATQSKRTTHRHGVRWGRQHARKMLSWRGQLPGRERGERAYRPHEFGASAFALEFEVS